MMPQPMTFPNVVGTSGEALSPEASPLPPLDVEARVAAFRCYFMNGDRILDVHTHECADDAEVILKGWQLLGSTPEHPAIEIWEGKRLVARLNR
jgi:hypothetical protein